MIWLSIAVQHHPSRADLAPNWTALGGHEVVEDPKPDGVPSALRTYREALRRTPKWATHRLVVQDDTIACANFRTRAEAAIAEKPDELIAFCVQDVALHGKTMKDAYRQRESWARLPPASSWMPTAALCWPVTHIEPFLAFAERYPPDSLGDDEPVGRYAKDAGIRVWATVPSLIDHPDLWPSMFPNKRHRGGDNRSRVAAVFAGVRDSV